MNMKDISSERCAGAVCLQREVPFVVQGRQGRRSNRRLVAWYVFAQDHAEGILTQALLSPGSTLHALKALEHPRWEDYEYERTDASPNRLYWLGDGQASDEMSPSGNSESPIDASSWYNTDRTSRCAQEHGTSMTTTSTGLQVRH